MAGVPFSLEKWNAREQLLSADLVRGQLLSSRDRQDVLAAASRSFDVSVASEPIASLQLLSVLGTPISCVDKAPTWTVGAGYAVTIGAGQGYVNNPGLAGLTTDDSAFLVARWASSSVTFANPDATNPRIDVVIATPAAVDSDPQSRTVLVDPTTRAVSTNTVNKTTSPAATVSIVTGTAAATPTVPAIPAGAIPLFYVWVPASAASAARIAPCRASWRCAPYPLAAMTGVLSGCGVKWDLSADPTTTSAAMILKGFHRIVLDGEVMEFVANLDSTVGNCVATDSAHSPFGSAAPATWNKPYYLYLCGGRHLPLPAFNSADEAAHNGSGLSPVTLVESTSPPTLSTRQASTTLTVNGQTVPPAATLYVGLGFVVANTTRRAPCIMDEEMTIFGVIDVGTKNNIALSKAGSGVEAVGTPTSLPSISTRARVSLSTTATGPVTLRPDDGSGAAAAPSFVGGGEAGGMTGGPSPAVTEGVINWPAGSNGKVWVEGGVATNVVKVWWTGFDHRVGRLGMHVNP